MLWSLGLSIGESFAEIVAATRSEQVQARWYLPQTSLSLGIKNFLEKNPQVKPSHLHISSRRPEKIMSRRLGASVAQLVTSGFESWSWLRQPITSKRFELNPKRRKPLSASELVFGISERLNVQGELLQKPNQEELEFLSAKLKMMNITKVCLGLLHAPQNQTHENEIASYFESQGLEVYRSSDLAPSPDEVPRWRQTLLNAALASIFTEVREEVVKAFEEYLKPEQIHFWNGHGELFTDQKNFYLSSVHGRWASMQKYLQNFSEAKDLQVLHLGLEKFSLLDLKQNQKIWQSPWGPIATASPKFHNLSLQPTAAIEAGFWSAFELSQNELGYEPGPMSMGRAQKPSLFDVFVAKKRWPQSSGLESFLKDNGQNRFKETIKALIKSDPSPIMDTDSWLDEIEDFATSWLADEISLLARTRRIICTGFWAETLTPLLQHKLSSHELIVWPESSWLECKAALGEKHA